MLLPLHLIATTFLGLISLVLFGAGIYFLYRVMQGLKQHYGRSLRNRPPRSGASFHSKKPEIGVLPPPTFTNPAVMIPLFLGVLLSLFSFGGRHFIQYAFPTAPDEPKTMRTGLVQYIAGTAGTKIRVETYGSSDAPVLLFTHGWGMDSTEWYYAKRDLSMNYRLILWDLPGLGESSQPEDHDYSLENLAKNLRSVLAVAKGKPVILVGHSIGGMINLTFCKLFPELLGREVTGIVQVDTTYTNPVKTTSNSGLSQALQKPIAEPLLYAMIGLSPVVRLMNWFSYENGTSYLMNAKSSFAGGETRGQIDLVSRLQAVATPAVVARGTLAMFHWDARQALPSVSVPVLVIVGREDSTTLPAASQYMRDAMPNAKLTEVRPSAHYSLLEQNKNVNSEIKTFVTAHLADQK